MAGAAEIDTARKLFAAWSSGDVDAPREFLTEDAVLYDIVEGNPKQGWPAIREFFGATLKISPVENVPPPENSRKADEHGSSATLNQYGCPQYSSPLTVKLVLNHESLSQLR